MALRLRESYDWVVLGDSIGALLSACLAARLGQSVLVLPLSLSRSKGAEGADAAFDSESNSVLGLPGVDLSGRAAGLLGLCLDRLDLLDHEWNLFLPGRAAPQIVTPSVRLRLDSNHFYQAQEWQREAGCDQFGAQGAPALDGDFFKKLDELLKDYWCDYPAWLELTSQEKTAKKPVAPLP